MIQLHKLHKWNISDVPKEVLAKSVFGVIDDKEKANLCKVCKAFNEIIRSNFTDWKDPSIRALVAFNITPSSFKGMSDHILNPMMNLAIAQADGGDLVPSKQRLRDVIGAGLIEISIELGERLGRSVFLDHSLYVCSSIISELFNYSTEYFEGTMKKKGYSEEDSKTVLKWFEKQLSQANECCAEIVIGAQITRFASQAESAINQKSCLKLVHEIGKHFPSISTKWVVDHLVSELGTFHWPTFVQEIDFSRSSKVVRKLVKDPKEKKVSPTKVLAMWEEAQEIPAIVSKVVRKQISRLNPF